MFARARILWLLFTPGVLVASVGCKDRPYPCRFNNTIARSNSKLRSAGQEFLAAVKPLANNGAVNPKDVRSKYQAMVNILKDIQNEFDSTGSPMGTRYGSDLLDAYQSFLNSQQTIVNNYVSKIVQIVEDPNQDPATKWANISPLLEKIGAEEQPKYTALQEAQKKYVEDVGLKMER